MLVLRLSYIEKRSFSSWRKAGNEVGRRDERLRSGCVLAERQAAVSAEKRSESASPFFIQRGEESDG